MSDLPGRLAGTSSQEKRALLAQLLRNKAKQGNTFESATATVSQLHAEAVLDPAIRPEGPPITIVTEPSSIFLTGATGFLGAFLLHELLQQTRADMYCLVRSASEEEGKKRLQGSLESCELWDERLRSRIIPVAGDIAQPNLGLLVEQFRQLAGRVDAIYHCGALVKLFGPYEEFRASNAFGAQEVLRLAGQIKVKPVHYVSTVAVFPHGVESRRRVVRESDGIDDLIAPYGGYAQSKWVAEKLMCIAGFRGIPVCIYRPGWVSGHSKTGVWNTHDLAFRIVEACLRTQKAPDLDAMIDMAPVDYVSRAIVHLSRQVGSAGKVFHLVNPHPAHYREVIEWVRSSGYPIEAVSLDGWRAKLLRLAPRSIKDMLQVLLPIVSEWAPDGAIRRPEFDCRNTLDGLAGTSIACPPVVSELVETYLSYFLQGLRS
jgi:thioester reductase-like protein